MRNHRAYENEWVKKKYGFGDVAKAPVKIGMV
jgi:hypothetical protein